MNYAFARSGHEQHGVDHYDAKAIVSVGERVADRVEDLARRAR